MLNQMILVLLIVLVAIWIVCIFHRPASARKSEFRRHIKHEIQSDSMLANLTGHYRAIPADAGGASHTLFPRYAMHTTSIARINRSAATRPARLGEF